MLANLSKDALIGSFIGGLKESTQVVFAHEPTSILEAYRKAKVVEKKLALTIPSYRAHPQPCFQPASNYNNQLEITLASRLLPRPFHSGSATSGANMWPATSFSSSNPSKAMRTFTTSLKLRKGGRKRGSASTVMKSGG